MMKYFSLVLLFVLFSCGNKEDILLPKSNLHVATHSNPTQAALSNQQAAFLRTYT